MARILIISPPRGSRDGVAAESAQIVEAWEASGHTVMWVATGAALIGGGERPQSGDAGGQFAVLGMIPRRRLLRRIDAFQPDMLFIQFALASLRLSVFSVLLMALRQKRRGFACWLGVMREPGARNPRCSDQMAIPRSGALLNETCGVLIR